MHIFPNQVKTYSQNVCIGDNGCKTAVKTLKATVFDRNLTLKTEIKHDEFVLQLGVTGGKFFQYQKLLVMEYKDDMSPFKCTIPTIQCLSADYCVESNDVTCRFHKYKNFPCLRAVVYVQYSGVAYNWQLR